MNEEFEMSMMGYFLGLQIKQKSDGTFINQDKYTRELIKNFRLQDARISKIPKTITTKIDKDEQSKNIDITLYRAWLVACFIWRLVGWTLCLVCIYGLDSNLVLKSLT